MSNSKSKSSKKRAGDDLPAQAQTVAQRGDDRAGGVNPIQAADGSTIEAKDRLDHAPAGGRFIVDGELVNPEGDAVEEDEAGDQ